MLAAIMDAMGDRKRLRRRVVAGVMVAVLALGATAAAWVALRGDDEAPPVAAYVPPRVATVWPESGLEGQETARVVQYRADNQDPEVVWRRSPGKVVHAFVASVLGWSDPDVRPQYPGLQGPDRWYTARDLPCPASADSCEVFGFMGPTLDIEVVQPARRGQSGIWSVAVVRSSGLRLVADGVDPPSSGTIHGVASKGAGLHTLAGAQWYDGCTGDHDIVDEIRRPSRFEITLPDPMLAASPGCGSVAAGYAYAYAVARLTQPVGDPLLESAPLTDLTIVPIRVRVAGEAPMPSGLAEQVEPTPPNLPPVPWSPDFGYRDLLGWSIRFPPGWGFEPIRRSAETGVTITNDPDALLYPNGVPQHDVLLLTITHVRDPKPWGSPGSENALPFSLANNFALHSNASGTREPAYGTGIFVLGGYRLDARVVFGENMDPSTMRMLDRVLATFRSEPLVPGERTGDGDLLVLPYAPPPRGRAVLEPVSPDRALMVVQAAPGWLYALELDLEHFPALSSWKWDVEAHEVVYETHRWSWDGVPLGGDPTLQLASYPATPGWDGHVLVKTKNTYLEPASAYWP
jgi:hypothetical protein